MASKSIGIPMKSKRVAPKKRPAPAPLPAPELSEKEKEGLAAYEALRDARPKFPKVKITRGADGVAQVGSEKSSDASVQAAALGLGSLSELSAIMRDSINLTKTRAVPDEYAANEMLQLLVGIAPGNTIEALLAVQMLAVHRATVTAALYVGGSDRLDQSIAHTKALNNLARTFAMQAETLKKLRGTGEQKVTVEHRHYHLAAGAIAPGSQAILGDVGRGAAGGEVKTEEQSHERMLLSERDPMLGALETLGLSVQGAGSDGQESVSIPRGTGRGANGTA